MNDDSVEVTRPFDEDMYPRLYFSRQQLDCIALAREMYPKPIRTKLVAKRLGCTFNQAYGRYPACSAACGTRGCSTRSSDGSPSPTALSP